MDISAGEKFADSDLIGIPMRVLVSDKSLTNNQVEIKDRKSSNVELLEISTFLNS
ncbi:MAG: His/Gly/Thr/Pro-type tRNA ligase C-terminal domain-containing protein [Candidatus Pacebacteria bacterium]|nr:His/Gly/Thr/Pro-type tRNA ligase C-terminal domain-containing protein [Candidatus Paceibacterota bacterium]